MLPICNRPAASGIKPGIAPLGIPWFADDALPKLLSGREQTFCAAEVRLWRCNPRPPAWSPAMSAFRRWQSWSLRPTWAAKLSSAPRLRKSAQGQNFRLGRDASRFDKGSSLRKLTDWLPHPYTSLRFDRRPEKPRPKRVIAYASSGMVADCRPRSVCRPPLRPH